MLISLMEKTSTAFGEAIIENSEEVIKNILEILAKNQCFGQILSSRAIVSERHLLQAIEQTESAFANGTSFAKRKEMELLLRISGKKQFPKAIEMLGIGKGNQRIALIAVGENSEKAIAEMKKFLKFKKKKLKPSFKSLQKLFEIPEKELGILKDRKKALENAVLEKIALIALED